MPLRGNPEPRQSGLRSIGTHREIADWNIERFQKALHEAQAGGRGNVAVIKRKLDDWLDYRYRAQQDGTLDVEQRL